MQTRTSKDSVSQCTPVIIGGSAQHAPYALRPVALEQVTVADLRVGDAAEVLRVGGRFGVTQRDAGWRSGKRQLCAVTLEPRPT